MELRYLGAELQQLQTALSADNLAAALSQSPAGHKRSHGPLGAAQIAAKPPFELTYSKYGNVCLLVDANDR